MGFQHRRLGEILVELGVLVPSEVDSILRRMKERNGSFGEIGVEEGLFNQEMLARALARQYHLEYIDLEGFEADSELLATIPMALFHKYGVLPLFPKGEELVVAVYDPTNVSGYDELEYLLGRRLSLKVAQEKQISHLMERDKEAKGVLKEVSQDLKFQLVKETDKGEEILSLDKLTADTSPIVRLIDSTLFHALQRRASDIHIETAENGVVIKYRVDGVLFRATETLDSRFQGPIISRIKVMSELDISERRIPQDGRFKVRLGNKVIDFRVSIMPSIFGEDAVIRILDKQAVASDLKGLTLDSLGFSEEELPRLRRMIREPYGMVLVTGPTGSGKTTTLYAVLSEIHNEQEKIITIEDPVEYQVPGILQVPVNEKKGLTFARGLRSILRHDPDKIMVGEIRDQETAQIAVQSALTGHLVFSTVHANDVFDVIGRFLHMGLDPYNFVSSLNCIIAQRLVRTICSKCRKKVTYPDSLMAESGISPAQAAGQEFYEGDGCDACYQQGYKGRSAIVELLELDDEVREMIIRRDPLTRIRKLSLQKGMRVLRESALEKVFKGVTSLPEINRVTFPEEVMKR
ncbi:MAG: Flp pilus assembly complex ATPase component TadA [Desulfuromonadaceae bacterium]|nr:Flp pilus assembly complex ATPase component TadA [Desulfuromonadaceae bacterium]